MRCELLCLIVIPQFGVRSHALLSRPPLVIRIASYSMLPLDLHVLGTPPAFILSQDQTLHKNILNLKTQLKINKLTMIKVHKRTFFNCTIKLLKSIKSSCSFHFFVFPRLNCSYINEFQKTLQGFFRTFFKKSRLFCISSVLESNSSLKKAQKHPF